MTPKDFYYANSKEFLASFAKEAKTTFGNFKQIAIAGGSCSPDLAARLAKASGGKMTELEILYPDRYSKTASAGRSSLIARPPRVRERGFIR